MSIIRVVRCYFSGIWAFKLFQGISRWGTNAVRHLKGCCQGCWDYKIVEEDTAERVSWLEVEVGFQKPDFEVGFL